MKTNKGPNPVTPDFSAGYSLVYKLMSRLGMGSMLMGTAGAGRYHGTSVQQSMPIWKRKYRQHRKIRNKMARRSRRINRLRLA